MRIFLRYSYCYSTTCASTYTQPNWTQIIQSFFRTYFAKSTTLRQIWQNIYILTMVSVAEIRLISNAKPLSQQLYFIAQYNIDIYALFCYYIMYPNSDNLLPHLPSPSRSTCCSPVSVAISITSTKSKQYLPREQLLANLGQLISSIPR